VTAAAVRDPGEAALAALLPRWGLPEDAALRLLHVSENATFAAEGGSRRVILRLHRAGYHTEAEIRAELAWLLALRDAAVAPCVEPRPARDGSFIQLLPTASGDRFVVAFEPIPGRTAEDGADPLLWFGRLGALTAALHRHARGWRRPRGFVRKRWDVATILGPRPHWGHWRDAPGLDAPMTAVLGRAAADIARRLAAYGTGPRRFGLVHADLRLANLMVDGDRLRAIDFDDCGFSWWMYDFAAAVSFIEDDPRLPVLARLWLEGYRAVVPLAPEDEAMLPVLVLLRRLLLNAWIGSRADSDTARAYGGPGFTATTAALAERFLAAGPDGLWAR
jgi:Ser/Thr protein kinase RdoA (MazF antagonist)